MAIKCPSCGLFNPDSSDKCDCGYSFRTQRQGVPHALPTSTSRGTVTSGGGAIHTQVSVVDVSMPFGSMVVFMVKWAIASIPAFIILFLLGLAVWSALFGALHLLPVPPAVPTK